MGAENKTTSTWLVLLIQETNAIHRKGLTMLASFYSFLFSRELIIAFTISIISFSHGTLHPRCLCWWGYCPHGPDEKAGNLIQLEERPPCIQHWGYNMDKMAIPMLMDFTSWCTWPALIFSSCFFSFGSRVCCVCDPALQPCGLPNLKIRQAFYFW